MPNTAVCENCGAPLPGGGVSGSCPSCLMQLAVTATRESSCHSGPWIPPSIEELRAVFAELEILELLGQGGMGAVYLARQPKLDRLVALKILAPDRAADPVFQERFLREARTMAKLNHPHIVAVFDVGRSGDYCFILMEYVDGASLRDLIRDGGISPVEAFRLIPQICDAMQFAHERRIVHRDIKPENVLVDELGQVKIADFGLAKWSSEREATDLALTGSGQRMGTVRYMAPEQMASTSTVDHRADIYSLGVMFYEMLTGRLPTVDYTPPSRLTEVDARVDSVVERSLRDSPADRFQHAAEVKKAVERISTTRPRQKAIIATFALILTASVATFALCAHWGISVRNPFASRGASAPTGDGDSGAANPNDSTTGGQRSVALNPGATAVPQTEQPAQLVAPFSPEVAIAAQKEWASRLKLEPRSRNRIGMELRVIPPGEFEISIGTRVRLTKPLLAGAHEVTVGQFRQFVAERNYRTAAETSGQGGWIHPKPDDTALEQNPSYIWSNERFASDDQLPVAMVTFADAVEFCKWLSDKEGATYRLPTEAEWTWMSRAGDAGLFPFELPPRHEEAGWFKDNSGFRPHRVGEKPANPWGLTDTFGNICEMCDDGFATAFPLGTIENPRRPTDDNRCLGLGSDFADPANFFRLNLNMTMPFHSIGFRVVCEK